MEIKTILEIVQKDHFEIEHHDLKPQTPLSKCNKVLPLAPILVDKVINVVG